MWPTTHDKFGFITDAVCNASAITLVNRQYLYSPGPDGEEYNISGVAYFTDEVGILDVYFPSVEATGDCKLSYISHDIIEKLKGEYKNQFLFNCFIISSCKTIQWQVTKNK